MKRIIDNIWLCLFGFVVVATTLFLLAPLLMVLVMSFDGRSFVGRFPPPSLSLQWYAKFFSDDYFLDGLWTSITLGLSTAAAATMLGTGAALFLDRTRFRGRHFLIALFLSPLIVPHIVLGFGLLVLLRHAGLDNVFLSLLIGHVVVTIPYAIRIVLTSLQGLKANLVEAAMALGATEYRAIWDVVLPLSRTGVVAASVVALAVSMDEVTMSVFLIDPFTYTLSTALFATMRDSFNLVIAAASVLLMGITCMAVLLLDRLVGLDRIAGQGDR
jgi:putative spermidine/putrescine transport system permease protein